MSSDISDICEFEFYEWVMFNDSQATFPEAKFQVGRWLGPAIDVGSVLCGIQRHGVCGQIPLGFVLWSRP